MKKKAKNQRFDPAVVLGGVLLHLKAINECGFLAEAQDYVAEIDKRVLYGALFRAKSQRKGVLADALSNVLTLLNAVPYLQGDEQFSKYKSSLLPVLNHYEQNLTGAKTE